MRTVLTRLFVLICLVFNSGCVFAGIGAGIGAAVPKYDDCRLKARGVDCGTPSTSLRPGTPVRILRADGEPVTGRYLHGGRDGVVFAADEAPPPTRGSLSLSGWCGADTGCRSSPEVHEPGPTRSLRR